MEHKLPFMCICSVGILNLLEDIMKINKLRLMAIPPSPFKLAGRWVPLMPPLVSLPSAPWPVVPTLTSRLLATVPVKSLMFP